MRLRRGTTAQLTTGNKVFALGEVVVEVGPDGHVVGGKWGDNVTHFNDLPYIGGGPGAIADIPGLEDALAATVHTTGTETLGGVKTFTASPKVPVALTPSQVVSKAQMDAAIANTPLGYCQSELGHGTYTGFETTTKIREVLQGIKDSGATQVRIAAWWSIIEPVKDAGYVWTGMDRFFTVLQEFPEIEPLICVTGGTGLVPTGATVADYGQLCGALAARYGANGGTDQCHHWEIWNEANHRSFAEPFTSGGTPFGAVGYTQLLISASNAIRTADPTAFIVSVGLMSTVDFGANDIGPATFLQGMYDNNARGYFDAIGFHWYSGEADFSAYLEPSTAGVHYQSLLACRVIAVAEGDADLPFWITELGFPRGAETADANTRAKWLVEQLELLADLPWVSNRFIFQYKDSASGLAGTACFGSVDSTLVKQQPTWDTIANVNAVTPTVPGNSVTGDELVLASGRGSAGYVAIAPDGTLSVGTPSGGGGGDGGSVALGDLYRPMTGVWPAVDAVNGPLIADSAITNSAPSFTGLTFWRWDSGKFNTQSQNWVAVPTSNGVSANQCCQNVTTNRGNNYAGTGLGFPCHSDFSFVADTAKIIVAYWVTTTGQAAQSVTTAAHEIQLFAEHEGQMKGIREAPAFWPHASGGGNQMFYKVYTFSQARRREFRCMLSTDAWLAGVYIDTGAQITKAPNRPVLMGCFGDSWAEGGGNVYSFFGGNGSAAGVTFPSGCSLLYSNTAIQYAIATGFAVIIGHQGGTGYFGNLSSGISEDDTTTLGFTSFCSQNQVNFFWSTWGSRSPIAGVFGGWNDGTGYSTATYQARADKVYRKLISKDITIPILVEGIQSKAVTPGDGRDLANTGLKQACAALPDNVIGFVDNLADANYSDISAAGSNIGPDGLHPTVKGGNNIGANRAKRSAQFLIPRSRVNAMQRAA